MADESPVGSPLSTLSSDAFDGDEDHDQLDAESLMPPAKRQKRGDSFLRATPTLPQEDALSSISSDTEGEVPNSPSNRQEDDDTHEQVTICAWDGCSAGDMGNMDKLVEHIHAEHIETRQKKYTCEWSDCARKSMPHASGYALKAHMRSHTREKPFYCALPECDRAFTRSDALAKHMRTVHETEALRPSDPIPKSMNLSSKALRLKLAAKNPEPQPDLNEETPNGDVNGDEASNWTSSYPPELGFTPEEEAMGPQELYRLLRRQVHWAEEEAEELKRECDLMEEIRKREWMEKEVLLDQVIKSEKDYERRRREVLAGIADMPTSEEIRVAAAAAALTPQGLPVPPAPVPVLKSQMGEDQADVANLLASLHQG